MATTARSHEFSIPKLARIVSVRGGGRRLVRSNDMSTSENSASLNSNSDGESSEERSDMSDGPTPRKKPKKENIFAYSDNGKNLVKIKNKNKCLHFPIIFFRIFGFRRGKN
jgi:hypothetical protein